MADEQRVECVCSSGVYRTIAGSPYGRRSRDCASDDPCWPDPATFVGALETRSPGDIAKARESNLAVAPRFPVVGVHAILVLSELNELDAAYSIIDGMLLRRGQLVAESERTPANDPQWRQTQWLYTPATDRLRADPRFKPLCDAIGLSEYWRRRGIGPDENPSLA
jgi:hypothetical protein